MHRRTDRTTTVTLAAHARRGLIMCYVNSWHDAKTTQAHTLYIRTSRSKGVHTCTSWEQDVNSFVARREMLRHQGLLFYSRKVRIDHECIAYELVKCS